MILLDSEIWIRILGSFLLSLLFYTTLSYIPYPLDSDIFFHLRIADEYKNLGSIRSLPWTLDSIWYDSYVDGYLLFHQYLMLFDAEEWRWIGLPFFITLAISIFIPKSASIHTQGEESNPRGRFSICIESILRNVSITLAILLLSYPFLGRFLFLKGLVLFVPILFLYTYYLEQKNSRGTTILSVLSVWIYPLFPILLILTFFRMVESFVRERSYSFELSRIFMYGIIGMAIAILILPQSQNAWNFYRIEWFLQISPPSTVESIMEWESPGILLWLKTYLILTSLLALTWDKKNITYYLLYAIGMVLSLSNTKSIEWTIPIGILAILLSERVQRILYRPFGIIFKIGILLFLFIQWNLFMKDLLVYKSLVNNNRIDTAIQMCENVSYKSKVFIHWNEFPEFSYYCRKAFYPFGMNPIYSHEHNQDRYTIIRRFWEDDNVDHPVLLDYLGYETFVVHNSNHNKSRINHFLEHPSWKLLQLPTGYLIFEKDRKIIQKNSGESDID